MEQYKIGYPNIEEEGIKNLLREWNQSILEEVRALAYEAVKLKNQAKQGINRYKVPNPT